MRDKIGKYYDDLDTIFERLRILEENSHKPQNFSDQLEEFKDVVKEKIIDLDFRINELELDFETLKQRGKPRPQKDQL